MRPKQRLKARIVGKRPAGPLGHAERGDLGAKPALLREQLRVGRVRAGIAGLDIVDAKPVELLGNQQLILKREVDTVRLGAVP